MTDRSHTASTFRSTAHPGKPLLVLAAICLLTLPQTYNGGASLPHPHAIFQFWIPSGHLSADHHHDDLDHEMTVPLPPAAAAATRVTRSVTTTISQLTPSYESGDAIGGILSIWLLLIFAASKRFVLINRLPRDRHSPPEIPPPRPVTIAA